MRCTSSLVGTWYATTDAIESKAGTEERQGRSERHPINAGEAAGIGYMQSGLSLKIIHCR